MLGILFQRHSLKKWAVGALLAGAFSMSASADMLPMVVDYTQSETARYWWNHARPEMAGPVDRAVFSEDARGVVRPDQQDGFSISRVFQRADLSVVNAQQIARMTDATTFFLGEAHANTAHVGWLDSTAAVLTIRGELYDTRSGSLLGNVEVVGRGVSSTRDGALQLASDAAAHDLRHFQPGRARAQNTPDALEVVVHAHDGAHTFDVLEDHVASTLSGHAEQKTCRASEGEVALCVEADEDAVDAVRTKLLRSFQGGVEGIEISDVKEDARQIHVYAHTPRDDDAFESEGRSLL